MRIRKLLSDSAVYGITGYLTIISGILLTPLYTRMFTKEEYGIMDLFNTWNTFATGIIPLGLISAILRFYPDFSQDKENKKKNLGTILSTVLILSLFYVLIMIFAKNYFISYVKDDNLNEIYFHSLFLVASGLIFSYITTVLQTKFQKFRYMFITIINFLILSSLGFIFVYNFNMRLEGFYRAASLSMIITLLIGCFLIKNELYFSFDKSILKQLLSYSLPLLSVFFLFQATNIIDRILIMEFGNLKDVGTFTIGTKISGIIRIIFTAFATAWFPLAMSIKNNENAKETYKKIHNVFFLCGLIITSGLFLFRKELLLFFAPDYFDSYNIIGILGLYNFVSTSIYIYSLGLHIKNQTKYLTYSAIISIVANVIFSILFIYLLGVDGIAWGSLIGGTIWVLSQLYYSQKYYYIKFNHSISIASMCLLIPLLFFTSSFDLFLGPNLFFGIIIKLISILVLCITLYFMIRKFQLFDFLLIKK